MRVAVVEPGDTVMWLVDAPEDVEERAAWTRKMVRGDLDYNTLPTWTGQRFGGITQMVVDDWFLVKELPRNEIATALYQAEWPDEGRLRHPGICGPAVIVFESWDGETVSVPEAVVNDWILRGIRVEGL